MAGIVLARRDILFHMDDFPILIQPEYIQGDSAIFHPDTMIVLIFKDEQHAMG